MTRFIRNCWYAVCWNNELDGGKLLARSVIGERLVIYRATGGAVVIMEDASPHRFAPLSLGLVEDGCNIRCMYHGLKFAPSGECIEIPGQGRIPSAIKVATFPALVQDDLVWVWVGDPTLAPTIRVPPAAGYNEPGMIMRTSQFSYDAYYELVNDNLTYFSHIGYVHRSPEGFAASEEVPGTVRK